MIEIHPDLFIGNETDYESQVKHQPGWRVVHACKDPYHRQALGYQGRGAPKDHPEYFVARRDHRLILNLIDADDSRYVPAEIIDAAIEFIKAGLAAGHRVLVHCNQGGSRSASIGLLYLANQTGALPGSTFSEAEVAYRRLYPLYNPAAGIRGFLASNWHRYCPNR